MYYKVTLFNDSSSFSYENGINEAFTPFLMSVLHFTGI